jgi:pimeloyl-ACP methyl ester carboxylesterase
MPYANNDGVRIYFETIGSGPPLILHHGYTASGRCWKEEGYVGQLKEEHLLILMDARGHGKSDKPHEPAAYTPVRRVEDIVSVLDHLGLEKAHFWGYSMGGRVGFALARYAPHRFSSLTIGGMDPFERPLRHHHRPDGSNPQEFLDFLLGVWNSRLDDLPTWQQEELLANDFQALAAANQDEPSMAEGLETAVVPVLLYTGDRDVYHEGARRCAEVIPQATFVSLPGLGHGSAFHESVQILPHVKGFLERIDGMT